MEREIKKREREKETEKEKDYICSEKKVLE